MLEQREAEQDGTEGTVMVGMIWGGGGAAVVDVRGGGGGGNVMPLMFVGMEIKGEDGAALE